MILSFKITARTILHLGSELISSDGIALYELIKNSYDAGSKNVRITVINRLARSVQRDFLQAIPRAKSHAHWQKTLMEGLVEGAPETGAIRDAILSARDYDALKRAVIASNYIAVADTGRGMSLRELDSAFLTIGTRSKLIEKGQPQDGFAILGEKGIGRLSAMRLGSHLVVQTAKMTDTNWNRLVIDWSRFDHASEELLEDIRLAPVVGPAKT